MNTLPKAKPYKLEQKAYRDLTKPIFHPKGIVVKLEPRKGSKREREFPNDVPYSKPNTYKDRSYTRNSGTKANHIVQDYIYQREVIQGTNHERSLQRSAERLLKSESAHANIKAKSKLAPISPSIEEQV